MGQEEDALWTAQHLMVGQGLPWVTKGEHVGFRVLWSPPSWLPDLTRELGSDRPPEHQCSFPRQAEQDPSLSSTQLPMPQLQLPGVPGQLSPCLQPAQRGGRIWGTPSTAAAPQGHDFHLRSWESNWKLLTTPRGQCLRWWSCQAVSQRAGGQPQDSCGHRHVSKHCTLVAATQHIAFCTASSCAPMPVLQHKNGAKQSESGAGLEPGWGCSPARLLPLKGVCPNGSFRAGREKLQNIPILRG